MHEMFDEKTLERLDKFVEKVASFKTQYLSAILNMVEIRVEFIRAAGEEGPDYGRVFGMDHMLREMVHRQLYPNYESEEDQDPKRFESRYVLAELTKRAERIIDGTAEPVAKTEPAKVEKPKARKQKVEKPAAEPVKAETPEKVEQTEIGDTE